MAVEERGASEDWIEVTEGPLDMAAVERHLRDPEAGGRVLFAGTVRPTEDGQPIAGLHYEDYPPMTLKEMRRLAEELHARWPLRRLAIIHRVGFVPVGEASVLIGVASAHRAEAFAAAQRAMDRLKQIVPLWKGPPSS
jgi:molybdopterin synthase catalytic subunit